MLKNHTILGLLILVLLTTLAVRSSEYAAIDLSGFRDGIKHWNDKFGRDRDDDRLALAQILKIAENVLVCEDGSVQLTNPESFQSADSQGGGA